MTYIGIDVGSTYTKYCIMDADGNILELFAEQTPIRQKEYFSKKLNSLRRRFPDCRLVSCGYGRKNVEVQRSVNELTALAAGVDRQCPKETLILDIGGQDTKIIRQQNGRLREFFTNDKCAAGCGMFLKNTLEMLGTDFAKIDLSCPASHSALRLSSVCAVFAQTEIVEAVAADVPPEVIIQAVLRQILTQAKSLLGKIGSGSIALSGGLAEIARIDSFLEDILGRNVVVPQFARFLSAIGCAELCYRVEKGGEK